MFLRIEKVPETNLIGKNCLMSYAENKTFALWQGFMKERKTITNTLSSELISLQIFPKNFDGFAHTPFTKWACTAVTDFNNVPESMETLILTEGLYAVFLHKGLPQDFAKTVDFIFKTWLPNSEYQLDNRPHFELLGEKYSNHSPLSEEEVFIPICLLENL